MFSNEKKVDREPMRFLPCFSFSLLSFAHTGTKLIIRISQVLALLSITIQYVLFRSNDKNSGELIFFRNGSRESQTIFIVYRLSLDCHHHINMEGTTPTVNYLLSPMPNDYYDHHSLQPIPSSGTLSYYQSDAVDCFYDHHKSDFQSSASYIYHPAQQQSTFTYGPSLYDPHGNQAFGSEPNLLLLQNQPRLPSVYELSQSQTLSNAQLQAAVLTGTNVFKRESQDPTSTDTPDTNQVYEWMKGMY